MAKLTRRTAVPRGAPVPACCGTPWYRGAVTREDIVAALRVEVPRRIPGLAAAYLFGSVARGDARSDSDIDVGLLYETAPALTLEAQPFMVAAELESHFGRSVDLIVMNTAPVDLVHRILAEGVLLFQANPSARIAFEVRARNEYFDMLPILKRYRQPGSAA